MTDGTPVVSFPKNVLSSKTFWANILGPVFLYLGTKYGFNLSQDQQLQIITAVMALANLVLRMFTSGPVGVASPMLAKQTISPDVTMLFSPHLDSPVVLNPGTHEVTVPPVPVPPKPKVLVRDIPEA